jgi:hypothetical protein
MKWTSRTSESSKLLIALSLMALDSAIFASDALISASGTLAACQGTETKHSVEQGEEKKREKYISTQNKEKRTWIATLVVVVQAAALKLLAVFLSMSNGETNQGQNAQFIPYQDFLHVLVHQSLERVQEVLLNLCVLDF